MTTKTFALTTEQVHQFHTEGYLGPFTMCSPEEMDVYRKRIEEEVFTTTPPFVYKKKPVKDGEIYQGRHIDKRVVYDLCTHPAIIDRMASIIGDDLILWRSNLFNKTPGGREIPWHQDFNYYPIEPMLTISAWLAIDDAFLENSCPQLIPGSHRSIVPYEKHGTFETSFFEERINPKYIDESKVIPMELKAGQFFLFTERTMHYSAPNTSDKRRLGMSVRVTTPFVKVFRDEIYGGHKNILIRGEDKFGLNVMGEPPTD